MTLTPDDRSVRPAVEIYDEPAVRDRRWLLLALMCSALTLVVMSMSSLNVAIPALERDLDASPQELQWIVNSFAVAFAGTLLAAGALGDRFGRRLCYLVGLATFAVGSVVAASAGDAAQIVGARAAMGLGAALVTPATLATISAIFNPRDRPRAIAVWAAFGGLGGAVGPVVCGLILQRSTWETTIVVNAPIAIALAVAALRWMPETRAVPAPSLDAPGAGLSFLALATIVFAVIQGPSAGWSDGLVLTAAGVGGLALAGFFCWERRAVAPMIQPMLMRDRGFRMGAGVLAVVFFCMFGFSFLLAQYLQNSRGQSALEAGLANLPVAGAFILMSGLTPALAARHPISRFLGFGVLVVAIAFGGLSQVETSTPFPVLLALLALIGLGMSLTVAPATILLMSAVPPEAAGRGAALVDTTREMGGALGIAVLGSIAATVLGQGERSRSYADAFSTAMASAAGLLIVLGVGLWLLKAKGNEGPVPKQGGSS